jgi:hypothetical protein
VADVELGPLTVAERAEVDALRHRLADEGRLDEGDYHGL